MEHGPDWPARVAASIGRRVAYFRDRTKDEHGRKLTAQALADRCTHLGLPLARPTISKLEKGLRETITVGELQVLARALGVAPVDLLFPIGQEQGVEVLPGQQMEPWSAYRWFTDSRPAAMWDEHERLCSLLSELAAERRMVLELAGTAEEGTRTTVDMQVRTVASAMRRLRSDMRERGLTPPPLPGGLAYIETQEDTVTMPPVVAAIVTSDRGVLIGRRNDGKPPWTFIAGEQDAVQDENPADTAVREVKEETGLRVQAGEVIGERVHPKTGRTMIYMAAAPTHGTDVFVGDEDELAEVRWVSLAEADELLPGMFGPVREHLARELGED